VFLHNSTLIPATTSTVMKRSMLFGNLSKIKCNIFSILETESETESETKSKTRKDKRNDERKEKKIFVNRRKN
jgi:hypothetical protein